MALRLTAAVAIGVWVQWWALIFAVRYADVFNDLVCNSSFYGRPECSAERPFSSIIIWIILLLTLLFGSTVPAALFGARWWQVMLELIIAPFVTAIAIFIPIVFILALIAAQS